MRLFLVSILVSTVFFAKFPFSSQADGLTKLEQQINIINQEYAITGSTYAPTDNSLGIFRWDADKYTGATVYFEAVVKSSYIFSMAYAQLYTTAGVVLSGSEVSADAGYNRLRSGALSLTDDTDYTVRIKNESADQSTLIKSARLIIVQSDAVKITDTETVIELGGNEQNASASYEQLSDEKIYSYDSSKFSGTPTTTFEATIQSPNPTIEQQINIVNQEFSILGTTYSPTDNSLGIVHWDADKYSDATVYFEVVIYSSYLYDRAYAQLYTTAGATVSGSEVYADGGYNRLRSGALTLTDDTDYTVRVKNEKVARYTTIHSARLIIVQSNSAKITDTETQVELGDNEQIADTSYTDLQYQKKYYYDSSKFSGTPETYFEANIESPDPKITQHINIIDQEYQVTGNTYSPTDNSLGIIHWDADKYSDATVYFEAYIHSSYILRSAYAQLFTTAGVAVSESEVYADGGYFVLRSGALSLTDDTDYTVRIKNEDAARTTTIRSARLVVVQTNSTKITDTEHQIEVGTKESTTATGATTLTDKKYYYFDSSKFSGTLSAYFEASLVSNNASGTAYAVLYNETDSETVSTVSITGTSWGRNRSSAITIGSSAGNLKTDKEYVVQIYSSDGAYTASIANAKLVLQQSDAAGLTEMEVIHQLLNAKSSRAAFSYGEGSTNVEATSDYVAFEGGDVMTAFEATMKTSAGTSYTVPNAITFGKELSNLELSTTSTSYDRVRTSFQQDYSRLIMNSTAGVVTYLKTSSSSYTNDTSATTLIFQISNLGTGARIAYAELYNATDSTTVTDSEVSTANSAWTRVRSSSISLTTEKEYVVRVKASNGSVKLADAKLIIDQSEVSGITDLEVVRGIITSKQSGQSTSNIDVDYYNYYDVNNFVGGNVTVYNEGVFKTSAGTAYMGWKGSRIEFDVSGSEISTTNTTYTRVRSAGITDIARRLYNTPVELDSQFRTSGSSYTIDIISTSAIVQINNLATGIRVAYAELYNLTDLASVSGSEISTSSNAFGRIRSTSFTLADGKDYVVRIRSSDGSVRISNAKLIFSQSEAGGVTALQTVQSYDTTIFERTASSFAESYSRNYFDSTNFVGYDTLEYYYEVIIKTNAGTAYTLLRDNTAGSDLSGTQLTTTNTSYTQLKTSDLSGVLPSAGELVPRTRASSSSYTASQISSWLVIDLYLAAGSNAPASPTDLLVNNTNTAIGASLIIYDKTPVFSAVFDDPDTSDTSSKYRIQVAKDSGFTEILWDSGADGSSMSVCSEGTRCEDITYNNDSTGTDLTHNSLTLNWRIKYWDNYDTEGAWSGTATFVLFGPDHYTRYGRVFNDSTDEDFFYTE